MTTSLQVLVIDDEPAIRQVLSSAVARAGHCVESAASAEEAAVRLAKGDVDVAICDIKMGGMSGLELLRQTRASAVDTTFIIVTAFASVDSAIEALKAGAADYIVKPVRNEEILHRLAHIAAFRGLHSENKTLRSLVLGRRDERFQFAAPAMLEVDRLVRKVAPTASTVLITGESGTGKGVVARQLHDLSPRREAPFIPVNCSAIPENLLESELFGHTKGAFTSADRARKGLFLQADTGTIFLDEIGDLPLPMQTKLLHVIEDKQVRPLGAESARQVDVRIVAATNRNLQEMVAAGKFREDLYFRLTVFGIRLPPLRERRQDVPGLIRYFLRRNAGQAGHAPVLGIDPVAEEILVGYAWPGNVRELENAISRALVLADGDRIMPADLPADIARTPPTEPPGSFDSSRQTGTLRDQMRQHEAGIIQRALDEAGGDRRLAAQRLGIGLSSLYRKLEEYEALMTAASGDRARAEGR